MATYGAVLQIISSISADSFIRNPPAPSETQAAPPRSSRWRAR
jgi:hypothetical protein